jgi:hypothetical protein
MMTFLRKNKREIISGVVVGGVVWIVLTAVLYFQDFLFFDKF